MRKRVYDYYREELDYLRIHGQQFSKSHPEIASLLDFGATPDEDPFVRRLVEAFAFLSSRVRLKLDDDFPRIAEAMLEQLLPFATRPIPAFSVAQFKLPPENADVAEAQYLQRNELFELKTTNHIKFRAAQKVACWPITVSAATYQCAPFEHPDAVRHSKPQSKLEITISGQSPQTKLEELPIDELNFFVQNELFGFAIHELIVNTSKNFAGMVLLGGVDEEPIVLGPDDIEMTGLSEEQALLPYNNQGYFGHQLLAEFLVFPQKFLFFKIKLKGKFRKFESSNFKIALYFKDQVADLERVIDHDTFRLGCCPVANLFPSTVDAEIELDQFRTFYEVIPDKTQPTRFEVYSVYDVRALRSDGPPMAFEPFYTRTDRSIRDSAKQYFHIERSEWPGDRINGSKCSAAFVDTEFERADLDGFKTVRLKTVCLNREFFNLRKARTVYEINDDIPLESFDGSGVVGSGRFVMPFTEAVLAPFNTQLYSNLLSHLNSSISSFGNESALRSLKNSLHDLDFVKFERNRELASLVTEMKIMSCVEKIKNIRDLDVYTDTPETGESSAADYFGRNSIAVCRGSKIVLQFDKAKIEDKAWYQFACVLDRFFAGNANINSFTKLEIRSNQDDELLAIFDAKCGRRRIF